MARRTRPRSAPTVSRQRLWQIARERQGVCHNGCDAPIDRAGLCAACYERWATARRRRHGFRAWKPGGKGRPPKDAAKRSA